MPIRVLDDHLINQIAAGEVVERPASIVKELIENAIDAGATRIEVHITGGGIEQIMVKDNGMGMTAEELPLAFARHATSKIAVETDLYAIHTLGFRGEALPSIASVARVEVITVRPDGMGSMIRLEGGAVVDSGPRGGPAGTQLIVSDLFFNTPARRKFLKSPGAEANRVYRLVSRMALSRPAISFTLANEKKVVFKSPGNDNLNDTVLSVWGRDFLENMLPVEARRQDIELYGLTSHPDLVRGNRRDQVFVVNGRVVRSPLFYGAMDAAYKGLMVSREFPATVLFLTIAPDRVDVNVHPQKTEVRFRDEKDIFNLIRQGVRSVLLGQEMAPLSAGTDPGYEWRAAETGSRYRTASPLFQAGEGLTLTGKAGVSSPLVTAFADSGQEPTGELRVLGQWLNSYILLEVGSELWLVDQHAAHERVMYDRLVSSGGIPESQVLALPLTFDLPVEEMQVLENYLGVYSEFGFDLDVMGRNTVALRGAPALLKGQEREAMEEMLELLREGRPEDLLLGERIFALMACKSAIKAGESLHLPEMNQLIRDWLSCSDYHHCPHGRPAMVVISADELARRLKRQ
ncbi:MAG: DNA mismatch repair endonuclease MutL [Syntrophomonadaceae bacterium]|nr:DNA mismatch repair endonuclease MutL [Syntrophomonadaceae bacterium]